MYPSLAVAIAPIATHFQLIGVDSKDQPLRCTCVDLAQILQRIAS